MFPVVGMVREYGALIGRRYVRGSLSLSGCQTELSVCAASKTQAGVQTYSPSLSLRGPEFTLKYVGAIY